MNSREKVFIAIKTREPLEAPFLSLGLILKTGGIEAAGTGSHQSDKAICQMRR
ncbi:hypothetical protein [Lachnoclostridium sp. An138]|uniref:hypothetical protein n=1 Tax=Lachnoclostridium sp. An138 TaxID=1965560 RepID=UPI001FA8D2A2|nr:hypothetical protein [Lachnoclostridium sp. An138]